MMKNYHTFIGIDIGKFTFVTAVYGKADTKEYKNDYEGIHEFLEDHEDLLADSLCILETTGGYELKLLYTLCQLKLPVHRADTRKVKNFIRSYGNAVKTDHLDAKALAKYGLERHQELSLFTPQSENAIALFELVQRRFDLKQMSVAEKNRKKSPRHKSRFVQDSFKVTIEMLNQQIKAITDEIKQLIKSDKVLHQKAEMLKTVPGIGDITAFELLILLPELGKLDRRKIASLAGLAPLANDSGRYSGYRRTGHGRKEIKPILFLAAMAARNSKSDLKEFYEKLIAKGKKKMVALTALMRKILVRANAKLKELAIA